MFLLSFAVLIVATSAASVCKCENYSLLLPFDPSNLTAVPDYRRLLAYGHSICRRRSLLYNCSLCCHCRPG